MQADEAGTRAAFKIQRKEILQPLVARHPGRFVKLMGDSPDGVRQRSESRRLCGCPGGRNRASVEAKPRQSHRGASPQILSSMRVVSTILKGYTRKIQVPLAQERREIAVQNVRRSVEHHPLQAVQIVERLERLDFSDVVQKQFLETRKRADFVDRTNGSTSVYVQLFQVRQPFNAGKRRESSQQGQSQRSKSVARSAAQACHWRIQDRQGSEVTSWANPATSLPLYRSTKRSLSVVHLNNETALGRHSKTQLSSSGKAEKSISVEQ